MKESFQRIVAWTKKHPWVAALIVGGVILLAYLAYKRSGGGGGEEAAVTVSQTPASSGSSGDMASGSAGVPAMPIPTPSGYDVPIPIPTPTGGGGGSGGGKNKGSQVSVGAGSYTTSTLSATDPSLYGGDTAIPGVSRLAADQFFAGLAPDSETMSVFNQISPLGDRANTPMHTPGGRNSGMKSGGSVNAGPAPSISSRIGTTPINRAASQNTVLPASMLGPKPAPLSGVGRSSGLRSGLTRGTKAEIK